MVEKNCSDYFRDSQYDLSHGNVIQGDTLNVLEELPENEFHAIVCDPPYNFDGGFMQNGWDDIGTAKEYQQWCEEWAKKALHTLRPAGHIIAFSGNRSHHRLMAGIEDAGYEIRDTITWHYSNGFPKGQKIERWLDDEYVDQFGEWRGMLKPATEFAVLARAPLEGTSSTKNQMKHGTGNLNVEACRIPLVDESEAWEGGSGFNEADGNSLEGSKSGELNTQNSGLGKEGRYPPNLALDKTMSEVMNLFGENYSIKNVNEDCVEDNLELSRFFYCSKSSKSERTHNGAVENNHPTVKPVDLMEWLVKMVTAQGQKVLDPFAGSGTTLVASEIVGRECVGIEMEDEYVEIAEKRFNSVSE